MIKELTQERLKEVVTYNPDTGFFTWSDLNLPYRSNGKRIGMSPSRDGYARIGIDNCRYQAHRLAFLYMTGSFPTLVDHINGDRMDNSWKNLRVCDRSQNLMNSRVRSNNTSGYKGVSWSKVYNKWSVQLWNRNTKVVHKLVDDLELAILVAEEARNKYHGEFARHN